METALAYLLALAFIGGAAYLVYKNKKEAPKKGGGGGGAPDVDPGDNTSK